MNLPHKNVLRIGEAMRIKNKLLILFTVALAIVITGVLFVKSEAVQAAAAQRKAVGVIKEVKADIENKEAVNKEAENKESANKAATGMISILNEDKTSLISFKFYVNDDGLYFKVPEIFEESFFVSADEWKKEAEAALKILLNGLESSSKHCRYEVVREDNGDSLDNTSQYKVTFTDEALKECFEIILNGMYSDSTISPYLTLLTQTCEITKEMLKSECDSLIQTSDEINYTVCIKDNRLVGLKTDSYVYDGLRFIGDISILDSSEEYENDSLFEEALDVFELTDEEIHQLYDEAYNNKELIKSVTGDMLYEQLKMYINY